MAKLPAYGSPLTLAQAKTVMAACETVCAARDWPMVIAILDSHGRLVMQHALDNVQTASYKIAQLKAETALNFRRPTRALEDRIALGGVNLKLLAMPGLVPVEGGLPLLLDGQIVGAVGVSGMASDEDGEVAAAGAAALA